MSSAASSVNQMNALYGSTILRYLFEKPYQNQGEESVPKVVGTSRECGGGLQKMTNMSDISQ